MTFGSYQVGTLRVTPVPALSPDDEAVLAALARRAWSLKRSLDTRTETSHAFVLPALLQVEGATLPREPRPGPTCPPTEAELAKIQAEIDDRCFDLYGIDEDEAAPSRGLLRGGRRGWPEPTRRTTRSEGAESRALTEELARLGGRGRLRPLRHPPRDRRTGSTLGARTLRPAAGLLAGMLTGDDGLPLEAPPGLPDRLPGLGHPRR